MTFQSRLEALNQIQEMLSVDKDKSDSHTQGSTVTSSDTRSSGCLLNAVHQQFLIGCFGLGILNSDTINSTEIHHYQVVHESYGNFLLISCIHCTGIVCLPISFNFHSFHTVQMRGKAVLELKFLASNILAGETDLRRGFCLS
jgi:hypothetical protein